MSSQVALARVMTCSTPDGIGDDGTLRWDGAAEILSACSTPDGIGDDGTVTITPGPVGEDVLNA